MTDIDARLWNWGRVVRESMSGPRRVGSLEGQWRSPQWDQPVYALLLPLTGRDIKDGWEVEAAWVSLADKHRQALRYRYCWRTAVREGPLLLAKGAILSALNRSEGQNRSMVREIIKRTLAIVSRTTYNDATT